MTPAAIILAHLDRPRQAAELAYLTGLRSAEVIQALVGLLAEGAVTTEDRPPLRWYRRAD